MVISAYILLDELAIICDTDGLIGMLTTYLKVPNALAALGQLTAMGRMKKGDPHFSVNGWLTRRYRITDSVVRSGQVGGFTAWK